MKIPEPFINLLVAEYHCRKQDLVATHNTLTLTASSAHRRAFSPELPFFSMVCAGEGAVITADAHLHPFLNTWIHDRVGHWLFELPNLMSLEKEFNRFGYTSAGTYHTFFVQSERAPTRAYPTQPLSAKELLPFAGDERFANAIFPHKAPSFGVCAMDGEKIMGMATCTEDAPHLMQIGVDVLPAYRARGIGTHLVTRIKEQILENGDIPYYMTSAANTHSWNLALHAGFRPVLTEILAVKQAISLDNSYAT